MNIKEDFNYQEGRRAAKGVIPFIEKTIYGDLNNACETKAKLITNFESTFGYTPESNKPFDRNYAYNYGMLDEFKENLNKKN